METIDYVLATAADVQLLVDCRMAFSDALAGRQPPEIERKLRESLASYFGRETNKNYLCWYATVNGHVAAIAGLCIRVSPANIKNPSGIWGYIMNVYTLPEYRRKGLSKGVLERLMQTGRERGITAFELHATSEGEPVYISSGFELHNEPTYRKFFKSAP